MTRIPYGGIGMVLLACAAAGLATGARGDDAGVVASRPVGRWQDASLEDYRKHLVALQGLTQACAKGRNVASCDPVLVGPDDRIPLGAGDGAGRRMVRYGWLRILFSRAEEPDKAQQAPGTSKPGDHGNGAQGAAVPPTTSELLQDAEERLKNDLAQTARPFAEAARHDHERAVLKSVLEGREFRDLKQPTSRDTVLERVNNWLNRTFARIDKLRARSAWVGRALLWGFFLAVGIGLGLGLMRIERRWRVRLVPANDRPAPDAASARDWQLWMADARAAAGRGAWREAIHCVYWASISRLESKGKWPADRARTPREYLALMGNDDGSHDVLAALTRSFERTWYGGRAAGAEDYRAAETLASELVAGGGTTRGGEASAARTAAEGGAA
jgi:Domain of unknown function (DUF4129)